MDTMNPMMTTEKTRVKQDDSSEEEESSDGAYYLENEMFSDEDYEGFWLVQDVTCNLNEKAGIPNSIPPEIMERHINVMLAICHDHVAQCTRRYSWTSQRHEEQNHYGIRLNK